MRTHSTSGQSACRYIKLTSPLINVVMCVEVLLFYTTMVLLGVPTTSIDVQCTPDFHKG